MLLLWCHQMLNFSSNKFSDAPPGLFANCQKWKSFDASNNSLHSEIPSHLGNCTNLQVSHQIQTIYLHVCLFSLSFIILYFIVKIKITVWFYVYWL